MSKQSRRELLCSLIPMYKTAGKAQRKEILDQFVKATGYSRKYGISLLGGEVPKQAEQKRNQRGTQLSEEAVSALISIWEVCNRICGKRLVQAIPAMVANLERHGNLELSLEAKEQLLKVSAATIDRLLKAERTKTQRSLSLTRKSSLVKNKVPIRTFADWNEVVPGFLEIDTVGHCSFDPGGAFLHTLNVTDIATCWTIPTALLRKTSAEVTKALGALTSILPFPLLGLDFDNGSEFLNEDLIAWCEQRSVTYTRSREYKKNDQAWIEEKNRSVVRKAVGRARFEGVAAFNKLSELYSALAKYFNFFMPCQKLVSKSRYGSKTIKRHDQAKTPYHRVLASEHVSAEQKLALEAEYAQLDALALHTRIVQLQSELGALTIELANPVAIVATAQRNATHKFVASRRACEATKLPAARRQGLIPFLASLVETLETGRLVTADDFAIYGERRDISRALHVFQRRGMLRRMRPGVYECTGIVNVHSKPRSRVREAFDSLESGTPFELSSLCRNANQSTVASYVRRALARGVVKQTARGIYEKLV